MQEKRFGSFSSSADPEELGRKWQGVFISISTALGAVVTLITLPVVGSLFTILGLSDNLGSLAQSITTIIVTIGTLGGAILAVYGAVYNVFVIVWDKWLSRIPFLQ